MEQYPGLRKETGVFWVEVAKIRPNSMQPRRVFSEQPLNELAESIRQYGVLQPLVVIRHEKEVPTGSLVEYELIAGERRWRASQIAGLDQVPVIIREDPSEKVKLELALIENLQREDLSSLERAEAFKQLIDNFKMKHYEVGKKIGKSREFVSNTVRLLSLPEEIQDGLRNGLINEGHTRPILSLTSNKDEQMAFYKEIVYRKMTVREAESVGRELVKKHTIKKVRAEKEDPETDIIRQRLSDVLGTRVSVEPKGQGKKISIEFFSEEEFNNFMAKMNALNFQPMVQTVSAPLAPATPAVPPEEDGQQSRPAPEEIKQPDQNPSDIEAGKEEKQEPEDTSWLKNFSI